MANDISQHQLNSDADYEPARVNGRFAPGSSGNPGGRPKGTRNRLNAVLDVFLLVFEELGVDELRKFAKRDPKTFYSLVNKMLPRHSEIAIDENKEKAIITVINAVDKCDELKAT